MKSHPALVDKITGMVKNSGVTEIQLTELAALGVNGMAKVMKVACTVADEGNEEIQSASVLPDKCAVLDVFIDVTTESATDTVDIGTSGDASDDPDGFLDGVSIGTAGLVRGSVANGASTYGALLKEDVTGSTQYAKNIDVSSGGEAISFTASAGSNGAVFDIYVVYIEL